MESGNKEQTWVLRTGDKLDPEPLSQHVRCIIKVPGGTGFSSVEVGLLLDSGLEITLTLEELLAKILREQPLIELTYPFERRTRVVTTFRQQKEINTHACPLHLIVGFLQGNIRFTVPFLVFPGLRNLVIIRQLPSREVLEIGVMGQVRDIIKRVNVEMSDEEPHMLATPMIKIDNRIHLTPQGIGKRQEGNGWMHG